MQELINRFKTLTLTKGEKKIADYLIEHGDTVGLYTASVLASEIGVSYTALINFIRKIGYSGYSQFRSELNARITEQIQHENEGAFSDIDSVMTDDNSAAYISRSIFEILSRAFTKIDSSEIDKAVDTILNSRNKYVAGFLTTAGCAQYMASRLRKLIPHVNALTTADSSSLEPMLDIGKDDCLIVYSFLRNAKIVTPLMDLAKQKGAKIILVTDSAGTKIAAMADILLIANINGVEEFNYSYIAPLCVSEVILMTIVHLSGEDCESRMHQMDEIMEKTHLL